MEMTKDMLRRIANRMVDLWSYTRNLEIIVVEEVSRDLQLSSLLQKRMEDARGTPEYQALCNQMFEELKGDA